MGFRVLHLIACCVLAASGCAWLRGDAPAAAEALPAFSGERAFAYLEALVALGPRVAGTPGAGQARTYVRAELEGLGLSVHEDEFRYASEPGASEQVLANLWAEIPGTHTGLYIVATPLDTPPGASPAANEGGSGAALLLELARALHERSLPYSVRLLFLDGELLTNETAFLGSAHAYNSLGESGELQTLRLVLYVHQVGDRELEIRRDRSSDRVLREVFFAAARGVGLAAAFPSAAPYDDVRLGHRAFIARRFTRVVALADLRYGGPDIPGEYWRTPQDDLAHCSPESLAAVGTVVLNGLEAAAQRQLVVDRASGAARPQEDGHP